MLCASMVQAGWSMDKEGRSASLMNTWTSAQVQLQFASRWWLVPEVQWRRSEGLSRPMQEGLLVAPEYRTGPWAFQAGWAFWSTHPYGRFRTPATQDEHRGWLQVGFQHGIGQWRMDHRLRTEQRFLERHAITPEGIMDKGLKYVGRLRYRTRVLAPLNDKQGAAGEWQAIMQKEWLVRYGDPSFHGAFDQVRPAVHLGYRPLAHLQFTAGYQLQYLLRANGLNEEFNHTLMFGAFWRLPRKV